jgi:hypothetical protein
MDGLVAPLFTLTVLATIKIRRTPNAPEDCTMVDITQTRDAMALVKPRNAYSTVTALTKTNFA